MSNASGKKPPTVNPEFGVRAATICAFFSPPLATSTFHDYVNKGQIVPMKGVRGFYKLNDSLRRLGLREVSELPQEIQLRTTEEITRLAFHVIDPTVFPSPPWLIDGEGIDWRDADHVNVLTGRYSEAVAELKSDGEKHAFLQGVLDMGYIIENETWFKSCKSE